MLHQPARGRRPRCPAPRPVDTNWTTLRGRVTYPEKQALPPSEPCPPPRSRTSSFGFPIFRDVLIDPETRGIANVVVWLRPDTDQAEEVFPIRSIHPDLAGAPAARPHHQCLAGRLHAANHRLPRRRPPRVRESDAGAIHGPLSAPRASGFTSEFNVLLPPGRTHATRVFRSSQWPIPSRTTSTRGLRLASGHSTIRTSL